MKTLHLWLVFLLVLVPAWLLCLAIEGADRAWRRLRGRSKG